MNARQIAGRFAILTASLVTTANSAWACPMCKLALESDDTQPRAYMTSILFMMGTIFTLFAVVSAAVWWLSRKEQLALEEAGYGHLFHNAVQEPMAGAPEAG